MMIKRKGLWVNRYVNADYLKRILTYRNSQSDKQDKFFLDLSGCEMMRGFLDKA